MSNPFKYVLFSDNTYIVPFKDYEGNLFTVDILGSDIIDMIWSNPKFDEITHRLDNPADS